MGKHWASSSSERAESAYELSQRTGILEYLGIRNFELRGLEDLVKAMFYAWQFASHMFHKQGFVYASKQAE